MFYLGLLTLVTVVDVQENCVDLHSCCLLHFAILLMVVVSPLKSQRGSACYLGLNLSGVSRAAECIHSEVPSDKELNLSRQVEITLLQTTPLPLPRKSLEKQSFLGTITAHNLNAEKIF